MPRAAKNKPSKKKKNVDQHNSQLPQHNSQLPQLNSQLPQLNSQLPQLNSLLLIDKGNTCDMEDAIKKRYLPGVEYYYSLNPNIIKLKLPNQINPGTIPLHLASRIGCLDIVRFLASKGCIETKAFPTLMTPLQVASLNGHFHVVKCLIDMKAQINYRDLLGCTALHHATYGNYLNIVELLIKSGADCTITNLEGDSPLSWAMLFDRIPIINHLNSYFQSNNA